MTPIRVKLITQLKLSIQVPWYSMNRLAATPTRIASAAPNGAARSNPCSIEIRPINTAANTKQAITQCSRSWNSPW